MDRQVAFSNFLWRLFERIGAQGVTFIVSIVLARILGPTVYGTVALVTVFMTILSVFVDSGLGNALVQKKDADETDFSTVFYVNVLFCAVLYVLLFWGAPLIANFYDRSELVPLIRVMGISLIISGLKNVQQAYVAKHMMFKRFFFATLGGTIGAAVIGILMAYLGCGVWALVVQSLFNSAVDTIILWITVKWRPKKLFSVRRLKILFSFGWKLLASALIDAVYNDIRQLIIGKKYTANDLAYYNKGQTFPQTIATNVYAAVDSILFPVMSSIQDERGRLYAVTKRVISVNSFFMMPMMVGMAAISETMVVVLLGDAWIHSVPYICVFCFANAFYPINTSNTNLLKALGRSDLILRNEIIRKIFGVVLVLITMNISVLAMGLSLIAASIFAQIVNTWHSKKLIGYGYLQQLRDIAPTILLSLFMGAVVYFMHFLPIPSIALLVLQILTGVVIYFVGAWIFKLDAFCYAWGLIRNLRSKK